MSNPYYSATTTLVAFTRARSVNVETKFSTVGTGFDLVYVDMLLRGLKAGDTWTGTHNFTGATVNLGSTTSVITQANSDNSTKPASTAWVVTYVTGVAFSGVLPNQTGNSGKFVTTDGTTASWGLALPLQTGNANKHLATDGTTASWVAPVANFLYTNATLGGF